MPEVYRLSGKIEVDASKSEAALKRTDADAKRAAQALGTLDAGARKASGGLGALSSKLTGLNSDLRRNAESARSFGNSLTLGLTLPLAGFAAAAVKSATSMDSLKRGLAAVAGSSAEAERQLVRLKEVAKLPGLGFKEAIQGSINLQAAGLSAQLAERSLKAFGNALGTVGKGKAELDGVILALSQIESKGKVSAEEINQLAERVPQIRKAMIAAFGTADTEILQKAKITSRQFIETVVRELEKLPKVTGGAQNSFENLSDTAQQSLEKIGTPILRTLIPLIDRLAPKIEFLANKFAGLSTKEQDAALGIGAMAIAAGPAISGIANVTIAVSGLTRGVIALQGVLSTLTLGRLGVIAGGIGAAGAWVSWLLQQGDVSPTAKRQAAEGDARVEALRRAKRGSGAPSRGSFLAPYGPEVPAEMLPVAPGFKMPKLGGGGGGKGAGESAALARAKLQLAQLQSTAEEAKRIYDARLATEQHFYDQGNSTLENYVDARSIAERTTFAAQRKALEGEKAVLASEKLTKDERARGAIEINGKIAALALEHNQKLTEIDRDAQAKRRDAEKQAWTDKLSLLEETASGFNAVYSAMAEQGTRTFAQAQQEAASAQSEIFGARKAALERDLAKLAPGTIKAEETEAQLNLLLQQIANFEAESGAAKDAARKRDVEREQGHAARLRGIYDEIGNVQRDSIGDQIKMLENAGAQRSVIYQAQGALESEAASAASKRRITELEADRAFVSEFEKNATRKAELLRAINGQIEAEQQRSVVKQQSILSDFYAKQRSELGRISGSIVDSFDKAFSKIGKEGAGGFFKSIGSDLLNSVRESAKELAKQKLSDSLATIAGIPKADTGGLPKQQAGLLGALQLLTGNKAGKEQVQANATAAPIVSAVDRSTAQIVAAIQGTGGFSELSPAGSGGGGFGGFGDFGNWDVNAGGGGGPLSFASSAVSGASQFAGASPAGNALGNVNSAIGKAQTGFSVAKQIHGLFSKGNAASKAFTDVPTTVLSKTTGAGGLLGKLGGLFGVGGGGAAGAAGTASALSSAIPFVGLGLSVGLPLVMSLLKKDYNKSVGKLIDSEYGVKIGDKSFLDGIVNIGKQKFGEKDFARRQIETVKLPETREAVYEYAQGHGLKGNSKLFSAGLLQDAYSAMNLQKRANGGDFNPGWLLVGEKGPELLGARRGGTVIPNHALNGGGNAEIAAALDVVRGMVGELRAAITHLRSMPPDQVVAMAKPSTVANHMVADARQRGEGSVALRNLINKR